MKIGKILSSALAISLLATSVFSGSVVAKGDDTALAVERLINSVAIGMQNSEDPLEYYKALPHESKEQIAKKLQYINKQFELAEDQFAYYYSLSPALQALVDYDSVYTEVTNSYFIYGTHKHDDCDHALLVNDSNGPTRGTTWNCSSYPCSTHAAPYVAVRGTLSNDVHFDFYFHLEFKHNAADLGPATLWSISNNGYGGWTFVSKGSDYILRNTHTVSGVLVPYSYAEGIYVGYHRLFTNEWGYSVQGHGIKLGAGQHVHEVVWPPMTNKTDWVSLASFVITCLGLLPI